MTVQMPKPTEADRERFLALVPSVDLALADAASLPPKQPKKPAAKKMKA